MMAAAAAPQAHHHRIADVRQRTGGQVCEGRHRDDQGLVPAASGSGSLVWRIADTSSAIVKRLLILQPVGQHSSNRQRPCPAHLPMMSFRPSRFSTSACLRTKMADGSAAGQVRAQAWRWAAVEGCESPPSRANEHLAAALRLPRTGQLHGGVQGADVAVPQRQLRHKRLLAQRRVASVTCATRQAGGGGSGGGREAFL